MCLSISLFFWISIHFCLSTISFIVKCDQENFLFPKFPTHKSHPNQSQITHHIRARSQFTQKNLVNVINDYSRSYKSAIQNFERGLQSVGKNWSNGRCVCLSSWQKRWSKSFITLTRFFVWIVIVHVCGGWFVIGFDVICGWESSEIEQFSCTC